MRTAPSPVLLALVSLLAPACGGGGGDGKGGPPDSGAGGSDGWDSGASGGGAGGGGAGGDGDGGPTASVLSCASSAPRVDSVWDAPGTVSFVALGAWSDGREEDVTAIATWEVVDGPGGEVDAGLYTAAPRGAGVATLQVTWEGLSATCTVETHLVAVLNLTGDPAVEAAVAAAPVDTDADCAPYVLYPLDQSLIPADFFSPEVQWVPAAGQDLFLTRFETTFITLTAITRDRAWTPSGDEWWAVADPGAGRQISMRVLGGAYDAASAAVSGSLCGSPWPTTFETEFWGAPGAVFYWTPASQGMWQVDVGAGTATPWMDVSTFGRCVGCHSVNLANPSLFSVALDGGYGPTWVAADAAPSAAVGSGAGTGSFTTLDPSGTRMVRNYAGALYLDDIATGASIAQVPTRGWAAHPNWSPDGRTLVYASCASAMNNSDWHAIDCDLRAVEMLPGDTFGAETVLAVAPPGQSYHYPTFSPDSAWLAFNRTTNGGNSYANVSAELMVMPAAGGAPVLLARANGMPNVENSWPRWGPIVGNVGWIAYSSERPYAQRVSGVPQVWVTGVDLDLVGRGLDGSFAPVWLPGQSTASGNHTPAFVRRQLDVD